MSCALLWNHARDALSFGTLCSHQSHWSKPLQRTETRPYLFIYHPDIGPHRIRLSEIVRVIGMPGDIEIQIETENSIYILRKTKEEPPMIIRNAIRCNICGDEIESKHRHDYVECKCGACAVDGGHDYLRRCFREKGCYTDISETVPDEETESG